MWRMKSYLHNLSVKIGIVRERRPANRGSQSFSTYLYFDLKYIYFFCKCIICPRSLDPFFYSNLLYNMGQDFLDMQYLKCKKNVN